MWIFLYWYKSQICDRNFDTEQIIEMWHKERHAIFSYGTKWQKERKKQEKNPKKNPQEQSKNQTKQNKNKTKHYTEINEKFDRENNTEIWMFLY